MLDEKKWASDALMVQDACNLCGIMQTFARLLLDLSKEGIVGNAQWNHPCVVLFTNKIESLVHSDDGHRFALAYNWAKDKAGV